MTIQMVYEINNTYMVIDGTEIETVEDYRSKMLQNNTIKNVISPDIRVINNEKKYYIDISCKESLLNRFGSIPADRQEVKKLFEDIYCVTKNMAKYLISESDIVFRPEMIFRNPVTKEYEFLVLPIKEASGGKEGMKELLQFLMVHLDNSDIKLANAVYGIHKFYSEDNPNFSVAFDYFLNEIRDEEPVIEEEPESELFANSVVLQKFRYIPGMKEICALSMCIGGLVILGINLYAYMITT